MGYAAMRNSSETGFVEQIELPKRRDEFLGANRGATEFFQTLQGAVRWASDITATEAVRSDMQMSSDSQRRNLMSVVTHGCTASFQDQKQKIQTAWK